MTVAERAISVVPANEASWQDLQAVFGTRGPAAGCQCQRYKLRPREYLAGFPAEERAHRLREQTDCGHPDSATTSGLVAYLDGEPVGWCAVEPRRGYTGLVRNNAPSPGVNAVVAPTIIQGQGRQAAATSAASSGRASRITATPEGTVSRTATASSPSAVITTMLRQ